METPVSDLSQGDCPKPAPAQLRPQKLIAMNAALLAVLGAVTIAGGLQAGAQTGSGVGAGSQAGGSGGARPRGEYTMVSGRYQGGTSNAIYVLDSANGEIMALSWDRSRNEIEIIGHRKMADDAQIKSGR